MATSRPARAISSFICQACQRRTVPQSHVQRAWFSSSRRRPAGESSTNVESIFNKAGIMAQRNRTRESPMGQAAASRNSGRSSLFDAELDASDFESLWSEDASRNLDTATAQQKAHRLHVYATKHNTHITLVQPPRPASESASSRLAGAKASATEQRKVVDVLMSMSTGNIGFKKAGRGSYDAAFQLASYIMRQMTEKGITNEIRELEVVLRGFGAGREAVTKALLGTEGRLVRDRISAVVDATRLKQGGPRSPKPRRLG